MKKSKLLILGGIALAFSACSDDAHINAPDGTADDGLKTATITVGQWGQVRTRSLDTWSMDEPNTSWAEGFKKTLPADYADVTKTYSDGNYLNNYNGPLVIPAEFGKDGAVDFNLPCNQNNKDLYVAGHIKSLTGNFGGNIYILEGGLIENFGPSAGSINLYNSGSVSLSKIDNFPNIYNNGDLTFTLTDLRDGTSIYSIGGTITFAPNSDLKSKCEIHNLVYCDGNLKIQNGTTKYICGLEIDGDLRLDNVGLISSYIKAKEITFNGHPIKLLPEAYVVAEKISMTTSNDAFIGYTDSHALIETNDFYFRNKNNFQDNFSHNIYFNVTGTIDIQEIIVRDNGQQDNVTNKYNSIDEYLNSQNGEKLDRKMFNADIAGAPECGEPYGTKEPDPEPETKLVKVGIIEAPDHNHDSDKSDDKRHLSATCIDFDGKTFYASYHMRGYNWGNDTYDKDETEGCIETWTIEEVETEGVKENKLVLGKYMWTNDFDFNHLIIDGSNIITVGSMEKKGAIIGRIPNTFANFELSDEDGNTYSAELFYKVLTTEEPLRKEWENPKKGNTTEQFVDYKDAGDGNCVIKVGNEYFVATYKGYGRVDANTLKSVKNDAKEPQFVTTDGSAKHIVQNGDQIAVLYLNTRPDVNAATTESTATLATFSVADFPYNANTIDLNSVVTPVDGKNVLAYDGNNNYYACLGKGGLNINNEIINFGEDGKEPVNGVALDEKYIYVACGSQLRVLDINTQVEVAKYCIPNKSANYIKLGVINGQKYIAVAFGQEGVQVFRLEEAK